MKPTREQIEQADEKTLRVMVAEMMGWERWACDDGPNAAMLFEPSARGPARWHRCGNDVPLNEHAWVGVDKWPTDIADAMEVVEHMRERGYRCQMETPVYQHGDAYRASFRGCWDRRDIGVNAPVAATTLPLAVCKAALYAWINEPDNHPETLE